MGAIYKMTRNPVLSGKGEKPLLHPRVVSRGTIGIEELMESARERSSFSGADMKGAMQLIADLIAEQLAQGYSVELEGIGFFSVALQSRPVMDKQELRSESIQFKNVNFRCSKRLKENLKCMKVSRAKETNSLSYSPVERERRMEAYFNQHEPYISRSTYMRLCICSKHCALSDLNRFVQEGKIVRAGVRSSTIYLKSDKKVL